MLDLMYLVTFYSYMWSRDRYIYIFGYDNLYCRNVCLHILIFLYDHECVCFGFLKLRKPSTETVRQCVRFRTD